MHNEKVYILLKQRLNSPNNILVEVFSTEEKAWQRIEKIYYNIMYSFDIQNVVIERNSVTIDYFKSCIHDYKKHYITHYIIDEKDVN